VVSFDIGYTKPRASLAYLIRYANIEPKSCPEGAKGFSPAFQRRVSYRLGFALKGPGETPFPGLIVASHFEPNNDRVAYGLTDANRHAVRISTPEGRVVFYHGHKGP
jgi:hypothetical protein